MLLMFQTMFQLKNVSSSSALLSSISALQADDLFSDCRVHCEDGVVNCYKLLLVSCSDMIRTIFSEDPDLEDIIVPGFSVSSIRNLLSNMLRSPEQHVRRSLTVFIEINLTFCSR